VKVFGDLPVFCEQICVGFAVFGVFGDVFF